MRRAFPASSQASRGSGPPALPQGLKPIRAILDGELSPGSMLNVVGLVKDHRLPIATNGNDWKSSLTLYDLSTQDDIDNGIQLNIFRPQNEMPEVSAGDIMFLVNVKLQRYGIGISLITHNSTALHVFSGSKIPKYPASAKVALNQTAPVKKRSRDPNQSEYEYVSYLYHAIDRGAVPTTEEFRARAEASLNIKDKFRLLKDVADSQFADMLVQMAREPYDYGDKITIYVSDFTENAAFFDHTPENVRDLSGSGGGDVYGYTTTSEPANAWLGPYGKRAMQVTVWEPHAEIIRSDAAGAGQWLFLRNVHVRYGRDGRHLEGFLREDRGAAGHRLNVEILDTAASAPGEGVNPHLKDAIRRCRDYHRGRAAGAKELQQAREAGIKRRAALEEAEPDDGPRKMNSRKRRDATRKTVTAQEQQQQAAAAAALDLNEGVKCENSARPPSTVAAMLETLHYDTTVAGRDVRLPCPFTNAKYLAHVRVVDFRPARLAQFAVSQWHSMYDILSDNEDDDDDDGDRDGDDEDGKENGGPRAGGHRVWEWRFALQLEDANPPKRKSFSSSSSSSRPPRLWVTVDNAEAQYLTGLDASDLCSPSSSNDDDDAGSGRDGSDSGASKLDKLRECMAVLWGDLEERKMRQLAEEEEKTAARAAREAAVRSRAPGDRPPLDSDGEGEGEGEGEGKGGRERVRATERPSSSSRPFACCIEQFGVRVAEKDPDKMDAGEGKRWERMYRLCSTKICDT